MDLIAILPKLIEFFDHVYVILDALDECVDRRELLDWIVNLVDTALPQLHFLLTSRPEWDIKAAVAPICSSGQIDIQKGSVNADIQSYVEECLMTKRRLQNCSHDLKREIRKVLLERGDGM